MVEILDQHLFLEGPRVDAERARQRAAFLDAPTRPAFLAGRSYDGEPDALAATLAGLLRARRAAPGPIGPPRGVLARGLVAPHIDFNRGGPGVRVGVPRPGRGPATPTASSSWGRPTAGSTATPSRRRPRPSRLRSARSRSTGRSWTRSSAGRRPISSRPSSRTGASTPSSSRRSGSSTSGVARAGESAGSCRSSRASPTSAWSAARAPRASRRSRRCWTPCGTRWPPSRAATASWPGADLAHVGPRFGDEWRGRRGGAGARPGGGPRAPRPGRRGRTPRASSRRRSGSRTGTGSAACRRSMRLLRLLPGGAGPAPPLRAVARPGGRGHLRERELRAGGAPRMTRRRRRAPAGDPGSPAPSGSTARARGATRASRSPTRASSGTSTRTSGPTERATTSRRGRCASRSRSTTRPFVVVRAEPGPAPGAIEIHLSDGSREPLDAGTLVLDRRGVPYCRVKGGRVPRPPLGRGLAPARRRDRGRSRVRRAARPGCLGRSRADASALALERLGRSTGTGARAVVGRGPERPGARRARREASRAGAARPPSARSSPRRRTAALPSRSPTPSGRRTA